MDEDASARVQTGAGTPAIPAFAHTYEEDAEMVSEPPVIVIADDDWGTRMVVALNLEPDGYEVRSAASARELDEALADGRAGLVLLDIRMGGDNGIDLARRLGDEHPEVAVVFLTGARYLLTAAENDLAHELIEKPFTIERVRATVARLCPLEEERAARPAAARRAS